MIRPINCSNMNSLSYKGRINKSKYLDEALKHFSEKELAEFDFLSNKASKTLDNKVFRIIKGYKYNKTSIGLSEVVKTVQLWENKKAISKEVYETRLIKGTREEPISINKNAFAKSILEPLRKIYNK